MWFTSYLTGRSQPVAVKQSRSSSKRLLLVCSRIGLGSNTVLLELLPTGKVIHSHDHDLWCMIYADDTHVFEDHA